MAHPQSCGRIAWPGREWSIEDQAILLSSLTDLASDYEAPCEMSENEGCVKQGRTN